MESPRQFVCTNCKTTCQFTKPDNAWMLWMGWIMIVLGLFGPPLVFLWPPGLILVIVAYRQHKPTCAVCKSRNLIPTTTPGGQELTKKLSQNRPRAIRSENPADTEEAADRLEQAELKALEAVNRNQHVQPVASAKPLSPALPTAPPAPPASASPTPPRPASALDPTPRPTAAATQPHRLPIIPLFLGVGVVFFAGILLLIASKDRTETLATDDKLAPQQPVVAPLWIDKPAPSESIVDVSDKSREWQSRTNRKNTGDLRQLVVPNAFTGP